MLITVPDSHAFTGDVSESTSIIPLPSSPNDLPAVSLFDLLLSQLLGPSLTANRGSEGTTQVNPVIVTHGTGALGHASKSNNPSDAVTTNPLTNLLFLSSGIVHPQSPPTTAKSTPIANRNEATGTTNTTELTKPSSIPSTPITETQSRDSQCDPSAMPPGRDSGNPPFEGTELSIDSTKPDRSITSNGNESEPHRSNFSVVLGETLPDPATSEPLKPALRIDAAPVLTDLSRSGVVANTRSSQTAFESAVSTGFEGTAIVENGFKAVSGTHPISSGPRPASRVDPTTTPIDQISASRSATVEPPAPSNTAMAVSEQLADVITRSFARTGDEGPTTVRIRLDRTELGTIHLHLSMKDNIVSIRILTENQQSQQLIESQFSGLRQSLGNCGIECGLFRVESDSNIRQSPIERTPGLSGKSSDASSSSASSSTKLKYPAVRLNRAINFVA